MGLRGIIPIMVLILDGKKVRDEIALELKGKIKSLKIRPCLAIIQVGDNKESSAYVKNKKKFGENVGAEVRHIHLPLNISEEELVSEIEILNKDKTVHGILTQMPFPKGFNKEKIIECIAPEKDVDGLTATSVKGLWTGDVDSYTPATTRGVMTLLRHYKIEVAGKRVVVIGRSTLVGKPTALALTNAGGTVTICHSGTTDLEYHTLAADIIITAAGRPRLITEFHVKPGQVIIDVGITVEDIPDNVLGHHIVGDVAFEEVSRIVYAISPVPGGVGPMTVASLFQNLFDAYIKAEHN